MSPQLKSARNQSTIVEYALHIAQCHIDDLERRDWDVAVREH
jgi:hypothetical protein